METGRFSVRSIIACAMAVMLFSCENKLADIEAVTRDKSIPVNITRDVEIIYSEAGEIKMMLRSPLLNTYETDDPYVEMPEGLKVFFYDENMKITSYLTARYAISYENSRVMEAQNNVVIVNERGERLNTDHITWKQNEKRIVSEKFVTITTPDKTMYGDGLESDETFNDWVITKPRGIININTNDE
jgi:LPS export ABC transporter protein LptC